MQKEARIELLEKIVRRGRKGKKEDEERSKNDLDEDEKRSEGYEKLVELSQKQ